MVVDPCVKERKEKEQYRCDDWSARGRGSIEISV